MCGVWVLFYVRLLEFAKTSTFRWTIVLASALAVCAAMLISLIYWRTATFIIGQIDARLALEVRVLASHPPERLQYAIDDLLELDPRGDRLVGLFSADGLRLLGNLAKVPSGFRIDSTVQEVPIVRIDSQALHDQTARAIVKHLSNGEVLVIGRRIDELSEIAAIDARTLVLGLLPLLSLAIITGMLFARRALYRLEEVNRRVQRITLGDLSQRLPSWNGADPFDKLAVIVNGMLDKIEALILEIEGFGADIAHALRTPLTGARLNLERGVDSARTLDDLKMVVRRALKGLDDSLAIVTALLRLAEIEHSRRLHGFGKVALSELVRAVGELYGPIAEEKNIRLQIEVEGEATVRGDRDLLFQAIANLVDNAVKYTPCGGRVELAVVRRKGCTVVRVSDTGPGVGKDEEELVIARFYRSEKSRRQAHGLGLGLSVVSAIVRLHGFRLSIFAGAGCIVEIDCLNSQ